MRIGAVQRRPPDHSCPAHCAPQSPRVQGHPGLLLALALARSLSPIPGWQIRLISVDGGRCGWSLVGDGLSVALSGIDVAAPVAAPDPSLVEPAHMVQERRSTGRIPSRSPRYLPITAGVAREAVFPCERCATTG